MTLARERGRGLALLMITSKGIAGVPRAGNFAETTLSLPGWAGCALYGSSTYTCDSPAVGTADAAERAQAILLREIKACLGEGWDEAADRSSARYTVVRSALRPVSPEAAADPSLDSRRKNLTDMPVGLVPTARSSSSYS